MIWSAGRRRSGGLGAAQFTGTTKIQAPNTGGVFNPTFGTDLSVYFWITIDAFPVSGNAEVLNVTGNAVGTDGWFVFLPSTGTQFLTMGSSNGVSYAVLAIPQALTPGTWYFAALSWQNSGGTPSYFATLYTTGGLINSYSAAGVAINNASPQPLNLGGGIPPQQYSQTRLDKVGIWAVAPGAYPSVSSMWNSGSGRTYASTVASGNNTGLLAYYDLDEETGATTWRDGPGTYNGTATGTIVSVAGVP